MVKRGPTNPLTIGTIRALKSSKSPIWKRVAELLERPTREKIEVNLAEINRFAHDGETIVVPGKLLGTGQLSQKNLTVASLSCSRSAIAKLEKSGGRRLSLAELAKESPAGRGARLFA